MTFTGELWSAMTPIYEAILRHPFVAGLTDGSLPRDRFRFYAVQDALYLREFARALSLDPLTGRELWRVRYEQHSAATRPLFAHGLVYVDTGFSKADLLAIKPDGKGDVTSTHVAWKAMKGIGAKPSPVLVGDLIYSVADTGGVLTCLEARSGVEVWQHRVGGGGHSASLLFGDGAIYAFGEDGSAVVFGTLDSMTRLSALSLSPPSPSL
jgi:outer membrane protein assembly factor BamB